MNGMSLKYLVVTVVSIFLALGIGIFIGFMMNGEKILQAQFKQQIETIDKTLSSLKKENDKLLKTIDEYKHNMNLKNNLNKALITSYIKNGNNDINISIIVTSFDYSYNSLIEFFRKNGYRLDRIIKLKPKFKTEKNKLIDFISEQYVQLEQPEDMLYDNLSLYLLTNQKNEIINYLIDNRYIDINSFSNNISDCIIIAGGNSSDNNNFNLIDLKIINSIKGYYKFPIIGIQHSYSEVNYAENYKNAGLYTVDNVDEDSGIVSLIELIRGGSGNYGIKNEATSLIPNKFLSFSESQKIVNSRKQLLNEQFLLIQE